MMRTFVSNIFHVLEKLFIGLVVFTKLKTDTEITSWTLCDMNDGTADNPLQVK